MTEHLKKISSELLFLFSIFVSFNLNAQIIKVACIGDSVTYGYGIDSVEKYSYPSQLQEMLGHGYEVKNFGYSGATMLKNGHKPYWKTEAFDSSLNYNPNIVIIHLGLNDQGNNNWPTHKGEFINDYLDMVGLYKELPSHPKIYICLMSPTFSGHHWFEEGMRENFNEIQQKIREIAEMAKVLLINLHDPLYRFPELFPDNLHPVKEGATLLAKKIYGHISGDFGGLQLPLLYGENMVFQRDVPLRISGIANVPDTIEVLFDKQKKSIAVSTNGKWSVIFPAMKAGGPYKFVVRAKHSMEKVTISQAYIGEVWLASGQSNMAFQLKDMAQGNKVMNDSVNEKVHLLSMVPQVLSDDPFNDNQLKLCNASDYFMTAGWHQASKETVKGFSAIAYAFANRLQKRLNVPIGVICNAVGGSPTQSWVSREEMERDHETISLLNDTWQNPAVDSWVSIRMTENLNFTKNQLKLNARHPYEPTFLFDAGIYPLTNFNIKGVIWYQGESNTEHPELHTKLFRMLVNSWRQHFQDTNMPFYYVQLSSIDRPGWGLFRNSQRKLLDIPHTGMAVTMDVGDSIDVHPKQKWIVGLRLATIALSNAYNQSITYSGPLLDFVNVIGDRLEVHFKYADGLKTVNGNKLEDIEIAGSDHVFIKAQAEIKDEVLIVWSKKIKRPRFVRYGYTSFSNGNLINGSKLPASTFSNE